MTQIAVSRQVRQIIEATDIVTTDWKYQLDLWKDDGSSRVLFIKGAGGGSAGIFTEGQPIEVMCIGSITDNVAAPMALTQEIKSALIAYPRAVLSLTSGIDLNGSIIELDGSPLIYNSISQDPLAINVPIYHFDVMGGIMPTQTKDGRPMCILNATAQTARDEVF